MKVERIADHLPERSAQGAPSGAPTPAPAAAAAASQALAQARMTEGVAVNVTERARMAASNPITEAAREHRVAELKKAVARGEYHVNVHVVADSLIREAAGLLEALTTSAPPPAGGPAGKPRS